MERTLFVRLTVINYDDVGQIESWRSEYRHATSSELADYRDGATPVIAKTGLPTEAEIDTGCKDHIQNKGQFAGGEEFGHAYDAATWTP